MPDPILQIRNVSKSFGGVAANVDISFDVRPGEILGLIGPNGAGKSSLFNSISGAVTPDKGEVLLQGQRISGRGPVAAANAGIARTFQVVRSFDSMTVLENVMVGGFLRNPASVLSSESTPEKTRLPSRLFSAGWRSRAAMTRARDVLEFCGLGNRIDRHAHSLTPPEKRRLEVARALATQPRILLLDEVLTGLTPTEARAGVQLIRAVRDTGVTVVMVEHVMEVLLPLIDRAVVLHLGRKLTEGLPAEIVRNPDVIRAYLGDKFVAQ